MPIAVPIMDDQTRLHIFLDEFVLHTGNRNIQFIDKLYALALWRATWLHNPHIVLTIWLILWDITSKKVIVKDQQGDKLVTWCLKFYVILWILFVRQWLSTKLQQRLYGLLINIDIHFDIVFFQFKMHVSLFFSQFFHVQTQVHCQANIYDKIVLLVSHEFTLLEYGCQLTSQWVTVEVVPSWLDQWNKSFE